MGIASKDNRVGVIDIEEQAHRVLVIDEPTERRADAVAQQTLSFWAKVLRFLRRNLIVFVRQNWLPSSLSL